uniref:Uncharacterized protein n=1 Tax=Streptococcus suis TaxID=1307 RepID=A0A346FW49_STRSU|nr:hypothetical protein [Streptococcus suis]
MSSIAVIFDHRIKKFLQTRKRVRREVEFSSGRVYTAHQSTVFFIWWAVLPNIYEIISLATRDYMPYYKRFQTVQ